MVRVALNAIWVNKLRSFLTILGNVVAIASIMTLVSLIQGLNAEVSNVIVTEVGADSFMISRVAVTSSFEDVRASRSNPNITLDDYNAVKDFSDQFDAVMVQGESRGEVSYRSEALERVSIQGVSNGLNNFPTFTAEKGRLITPTELSRDRNVAVLGWSTADRLFGTENPLDSIIKIQGVHFRVVGVSQEKGSTFGRSQDEYAVIPLGAFQRLFGRRQSLTIMVRPSDPLKIQAAMDEATSAIRVDRRLRPREENNFGIFTSDTFLELYNRATQGIFTVLVGIVGLALVVAGIVIMNIMLMAVSERTREIGLRKALGAQRKDVMYQMLSESVILSLLGGILGTIIGAIAAFGIDRFAPVPAVVHLWSVFLAIFMTAMIGLFFGLYPASRAAALDPIEALGRD